MSETKPKTEREILEANYDVVRENLRAEERAAIVAWLDKITVGRVDYARELADMISCGTHWEDVDHVLERVHMVEKAPTPGHPSNNVTLENVGDLFRYHPPTEATIPKYEAINAAALNLAKVILEQAPACADRTAAIRLVTQARMQANAAIATAPKES